MNDLEGDSQGMPYVLWLDDPRCQQPNLAGNKGATLARLRSLGYEVPNGFCLTTAALSAGAGRFRGEVPEALRRLGPPWAVRSSANVEDSAGHAFPGLFATLLGLADETSLLAAIEAVDASAHADSVRSYAARFGIDPGAVRMAVLVQALVPAEAAGVAFSRDPIGDEDRVVVEANYGLAETVVDGSVTPDRYAVSPAGEVLARSLGCKREKAIVVASGDGVRRLGTSDAERSRLVLDDEEVAAIGALARRLERDLGSPVDVEWAFAGGLLHVLQARPARHGSGEQVEAAEQR
jgi:rifampicin phosphotransferase